MINSMENQQLMSKTLLDMRAQMEQISSFVHDLAKRLEATMLQETRPAETNAKEDSHSDARPRQGSQFSTTSRNSSVRSRKSSDSSKGSLIYSSPQKKKQRPSVQTERQLEDDSASVSTDGMLSTSQHDDVRQNLDDTFQQEDYDSTMSIPTRIWKLRVRPTVLMSLFHQLPWILNTTLQRVQPERVHRDPPSRGKQFERGRRDLRSGKASPYGDRISRSESSRKRSRY